VSGGPPAKGAPGGPDPGLESFVQSIEDHLRARRGVEHILSPRDFALAVGVGGACREGGLFACEGPAQ